MKGDFSRSTFDPSKHFAGVRMQQGRVQLDADWNEQADILLHLIRTQLVDLIGPGSTGATEPGFAVSLAEPADETAARADAGQSEEPTPPARILPDFQIGAGRYYVDGILCENDAPVLFSRQPDYPDAASRLCEALDADHVLVYLDVWERHITAAQDPAIREVALGGPDTTTRIKTVWQVKLLSLSTGLTDDQDWHDQVRLRSLIDWQAFVNRASDKGQLSARWEADRGAFLENRLYRVEIHSAADGQVTFKWSRENGSEVFPNNAVDLPSAPAQSEGVLRFSVENLDRDPYQLEKVSWVELVDDVMVLNGLDLPLCQVKELDRSHGHVTLSADQDRIDQIRAHIGARGLRHPLLRRWEAEATPVVHLESRASYPVEGWSELENGIQVAFSNTGPYCTGDYWLISARTQLADGIEWPRKDGQPVAQAPHGIVHHYAPLALLQFEGHAWRVVSDAAIFESLPHTKAELDATRKVLESLRSNLQSLQADVTQVRGRVTELEERTSGIQARICQDWSWSSDKPVEEQDVVSLLAALPTGSGAADRVTPASKDNERLVVGVVTEILNDQRCRVALYGRALCKVMGNIQPGDLLVPSTEPGRAQKAGWYLRPGTILGKALSSTDFDDEVREKVEEGELTPNSEMSGQPGTVDMLVTLG